MSESIATLLADMIADGIDPKWVERIARHLAAEADKLEQRKKSDRDRKRAQRERRSQGMSRDGSQECHVTVTPEKKKGSPPDDIYLTPPSQEKKSKTPSGQKVAKRGTRLSKDWSPSQDEVRYAIDHGLSDYAIRLEEEKFRNYWTAKTGRDATKLDWSATWRNWVLNAERRLPRGSPAEERPGSLMGAIKATGFGQRRDDAGRNGTGDRSNVSRLPDTSGHRLPAGARQVQRGHG